MGLRMKDKLPFKLIAGAMAYIFLSQQIAWAGDLIDSTVNQMNAEQSQNFAPEYLQTQEAIHQEIIDQKQAIEDAGYAQNLTSSGQIPSQDIEAVELKGPAGSSFEISSDGASEPVLNETQYEVSSQDNAVFLITTEAGDVIRYKGGVVDSVLKHDGTVIGYDNGVVLKIMKPDGAIYMFRKVPGDVSEVRVDTYIGKDGYIVKFDDAYNIVSIASPSGTTTFYNKSAKPVLTQSVNGLITYDDDGEPFYQLNGSDTEDLADTILTLDKAAEERRSAELVLAHKDVILDEAVAAQLSSSAVYADAKLKLDDAVKARQAVENLTLSTPLGSVKITGNYQYSKDGITIIKAPGSVEYDAKGRIVTENAGKGYVRNYEYVDYYAIRTTVDNFDSKIDCLFNNSFVYDGKLNLRAGSVGTEVSAGKATYETFSSLPIYSVDFCVDDQDPEMEIGLRGVGATDVAGTEGITIIALSSTIVIRGYKDGQLTFAMPVSNLKLNTQYTARFEGNPQEVKVYVWEKGAEKPVKPNCVLNGVHWNPRFCVSIKKGNAVFDNFSVSERVVPTKPNSLIVRLGEANENENSARAISDAAGTRYESALGFEKIAQYEHDTTAENLNVAEIKEAAAIAAKLDLEMVLGAKGILFNVIPPGQEDPECTDGTVIKDLAGLKGEILGKLDFSYIVYGADNAVREIGSFDGSKTAYDSNGLPVSSDMGGVKTDYSYLIGSRGDFIKAEVDRDGVKRIYDLRGDLNGILTGDNTKIEYTGGEVVSITTPDGISRMYQGGKLSEFIDEDASSFIFGADGRPVRSEDKYGNVYDYSYSVDPQDSKEVTVISDLTRGVKRSYKDDRLLRTEDAAGLVSDNVYYDDGILKEVTVTKNDTVIAKYVYTYKPDGMTEVKDDEGCVRIYSTDGRLAFLSDKDNFLYRYTYPDAHAAHAEFVKPAGWEATSGDFIVAQDFVDGKLKTAYRADGTATGYSDTGKPDYILDTKGEVLVDYEYDDSDDLVCVTMSAARMNLMLACDTARARVNSDKKRILSDIKNKENEFISYYMKTHHYSPSLFTDLATQIQYLNDFSKEFKPIKDEADLARAQVESAAARQLARIEAEGDRLLLEIARQEGTPLVIYYYRSVLGRDPDQTETDLWLSNISSDRPKIGGDEIVRSILSSGEYNIRKAQVEKIKYDVRVALTSYLKLASQGEEDLFLSKLGLTRYDIVSLSQYDIDAVLNWIDSQGLHFGQSAFLALKNILGVNGIEADLEEIAVNTILADIFTGAINIFSSGDLQLSMYGLAKYAESKGLTLYNTKLTFDDLVLQIGSGGADCGDKRVIAHVDGNHYIVVNNIEGGKVYYREGNTGPAGTDEVMSKDDFIKKWSGYVIIKTKPQDEKKVLSASDAKKVKGAFFGLLVAIVVAIIGALTAVVSAVVTAIAAVISMASVITTGIAAIMASAGAQLASGMGAVLNGIGAALGNAFGASVVGMAVNTAIGTGLSLGISAGMQALGINSTISGLTSSFLTGGILGLINPAAGMCMLDSFMSEGLKFATITGINELGPKLNLDPGITSIFSLVAGGMADGLWQADLGGTIFKIAPKIAGEFAYSGVKKVSEALGIDLRVGAFLSGAVSAFFRNITAPDSDLLSDMIRSINSGIVSVGVSFIDSINHDIPDVLRSAGLIKAVEDILNEAGLFNGAFNLLNRIAPTAFNTAGSAVTGFFNGARTFIELVTEIGPLGAIDSTLNSLFTRQTVEAVMAQGGVEAVLARPSIEVILPDGRAAYEVSITDNASIYLNEAGELIAVKERGITSTGSFVWTQDNGIRLKEGTVTGNMETGYSIWADIDDGTARNIEISDSGGNQVARIDPETPGSSISINSVFDPAISEFNYILANAALYYANTCMAKIREEKVESLTQKINAISAGSLFNDTNKFLYVLANGICNPEFNEKNPPAYIFNLMDDLSLHSNSDISKESDMLPVPLYQGMTPSGQINGFYDAIKWLAESQSVYKDSLVLKAQADLTAYFVTHPGEWNRPVVGMGYSGGFMPLVEAASTLLYNIKTLVGLGAPTAYLPGIIPDTLLKVMSAVTANNLSAAIALVSGMGIGYAVTDLDQVKDIIVTKVRELVLQSNLSGETSPITANSKTDLIVNVWGTEDIFHGIGVVDVKKNFLGKTTYNIEIVGAEHGDYMRRAVNDPTDPPDTWNNTVASFVTDLIINSDNESNLLKFFGRNSDKISFDSMRGAYVVSLPGCGV